jgi:hypothetical protein
MRLKKLPNGKSSAQAMVEFAIALPILLMLLYGILEAGRLLFIYSTVVTASRQAVRYGSTTGIGAGGALRYQDCEGIRLAANRVDFLNAFDHTGSDIVIQYDSGPGTAVFDTCDGLVDPNVTPSSDNTTRIIVDIQGDFFPIIPRLVPFIERSTGNGDPIEGKSARSILVSVAIEVTAPPLTWEASTATHTLTPSPTPTDTPTNTPTRTPTPTPVFTNTPTRTQTPTLPPTMTLSPTATTISTLTIAPTISPSPINCFITHGPITVSGNTMLMTLNSTAPSPVTISQIFVAWNHDKGHFSGGDKTLRLSSITLGTQVWSGISNGPSITITPSVTTTIPIGASSIIFTFHQSYDNTDGTEAITIFLSSTGCAPINAP